MARSFFITSKGKNLHNLPGYGWAMPVVQVLVCIIEIFVLLFLHNECCTYSKLIYRLKFDTHIASCKLSQPCKFQLTLCFYELGVSIWWWQVRIGWSSGRILKNLLFNPLNERMLYLGVLRGHLLYLTICAFNDLLWPIFLCWMRFHIEESIFWHDLTHFHVTSFPFKAIMLVSQGQNVNL